MSTSQQPLEVGVITPFDRTVRGSTLLEATSFWEFVTAAQETHAQGLEIGLSMSRVHGAHFNTLCPQWHI